MIARLQRWLEQWDAARKYGGPQYRQHIDDWAAETEAGIRPARLPAIRPLVAKRVEPDRHVVTPFQLRGKGQG